MGETSDQITTEIEQIRDQLDRNFQELEQRVKNITNWRLQLEKSPFTMIGMAFGGGILLAYLVSRNSGSRSRHRRSYRGA